MNRRMRGLAVLFVLAVVGLWVWITDDPEIANQPTALPTIVQTGTLPAQPAMKAADEPIDAVRVAVEPETPPPATPGTALVKVLVVDAATHHPLVGAMVRAAFDDGSRVHTLERTQRSRGKPFEILLSDQDGRVEIEVPAGVVSSVNADSDDGTIGFASVDVPSLEKDAIHEVLLAVPVGRDMPFWLKLVDSETRDPLPGVHVSATKGDEKSQPCTSDASGLALFQARSWQQSNLRIEGEGRARHYVVTEPGHTRADIPLIVEIPRSATLRVRLVDTVGSPLGSAAVVLAARAHSLYPPGGPPTWNREADPEWRALTDDSGRASITELPPGVKIEVSVDGRLRWTAPEPLVFEPGEVRDVEWEVPSGCNLQGLVIDQHGGPVARHKLWLRKAERKAPVVFDAGVDETCAKGTTDENGRFLFPNVSPGTWWVGPAPLGYDERSGPDGVAALALVVEIADGQIDATVTIRVDRGLFIRGHVLDISGQPAGSSHVLGYEPDKRLYSPGGDCDEDGAFVLGPMMDGKYQLVAGASGSERDSEPVMARPGDTDVVLRLRAGAKISGRVVGPDGKGVAGWVHLTSEDPKSPLTMQASVNNEGEFAVSGLGPGTIHVSATTSNADIGFVDPVELGDGTDVKGLLIRVTPGGRIRVHHEGKEKYVRLSAVQRGLIVGVENVASGSTRDVMAPAGQVVMRAKYGEDDPRVVERTVTVVAGGTVDLTLEAGAR